MSLSSEQRLFRKIAALLLGVVGVGGLLFGLVIGLSTVYGSPQAPSSEGGTATAINCGTPFSPKNALSALDDPFGSNLTDYGIKGCQATIGLSPHIAVAMTIFGSLSLVASIIVFVTILAAIEVAPANVFEPGSAPRSGPDLDESPAGSAQTSASVAAAHPAVPQGLSTRWIAGRLVTISAVGDRRYLRVQDIARILGQSDESLLVQIPAQMLNIRTFDTRTTASVGGRIADQFVDVVEAQRFFAGLGTPTAVALASFAAALGAPDGGGAGRFFVR